MATAIGVPAVPAVGKGSGDSPATSSRSLYPGGLAGHRTAGVLVTLRHAVTLTPFFRRPQGSDGDRDAGLDRFVGLEIIKSGSSMFTYMSMVWADATTMSVQWGDKGYPVSGREWLYPSTGHLPRTLPAAPVHLPAGRYLFTLLTRRHTVVRFQAHASVRPGPVLRPTLASPTDIRLASFAGDSLPSGSHSLPLRVPRGSHIALTAEVDRWAGNGNVNGNAACFRPASAKTPCVQPTVVGPVDPQVPATPSNQWSSETPFVWQSPPTGHENVDFDAVKGGQITGQYFLMIAFP